ncbi:TIR-only protein-like [Impatiens glandulifera]|uniref:TIR-only protein-like n=1 Tax=Impatiens glandulifera TaxID=253017 RepID=UPI001FB0542F|nr:TIR-only protein-like [Impatiens glandulifera]
MQSSQLATKFLTLGNLIKIPILASKGTKTVQPYDVFINHRGADTKKTIASLLYDELVIMRLRPFLDKKTMKPGDKLVSRIDEAIQGCRVGVAVFSPRYCDSYYCLHELALMMEHKKKIIPIFCDVKPSELRLAEYKKWSCAEKARFEIALEEAKCSVGLAFDSQKGNWSDIVSIAVNNVIQSIMMESPRA